MINNNSDNIVGILKPSFATLLHILPGLIIVLIIGFAAKFAASYIALGSVTLAIILGIIINNLLPIHKTFSTGIVFAEKKLLSLAIMLMGAQLNFSILTSLGLKAIILIVLIAVISISVGYVIGKAFKLSSPFSLLLGIGNAICGSSAIAGAAPLLGAEEDETGLSISVVNFLGTIGIFLLPFLARILTKGDPLSSGLLVGGTLQAVGQVTAAGFSMSDEIGRIATVVKMGRILLLGPVLIFFSLAFKGKSSSQKKKNSIPPFIIGFIILAIFSNVVVIPQIWLDLIKLVSKNFLILAMAGVGLKITFSKLIKQGPKALVIGSIVFILQIVICSVFILIFY
jgi:uncharacterized integral membrane protein (TIGR00698 family)